MSDISLTENAAKRIAWIAKRQSKPAILRLAVDGGGCAGFTYDLYFEDAIGEMDEQFESNGVKLYIDPMSYQYLTGAEIDYTEGLEGAQFVIKNPNATTTCGCGSSFST